MSARNFRVAGQRLPRMDGIGKVTGKHVYAADFTLAGMLFGKILRSTIRKIANGEPWTIPPTIEDPSVLDEVSAALAGVGLPEKLGTEGEI